MRGILLLALGIGCGSASSSPPTHWLLPPPAPESNGEVYESHEFVVAKHAPAAPKGDPLAGMPATHVAVADGATLRVVRVSRAGLQIERTVIAPAPITGVTWSLGGLAVMLATPHAYGLITQAGYEPIAPVTWPRTGLPDWARDAKRADYDELYTNSTGVWLWHCAWNNGDGCMRQQYAQVAPTRERPLTDGPPSDRGETHQLTWFDLPPDFDAVLHQEPGDFEFESRRAYVPPTLRCNDRGGRSQLTDVLTAGEHFDDLSWLAASPPLLAVSADKREVILERCVPSRRYRGSYARSDGFVVVYGSEIAVVWRGTQVGTLAAFGATSAAWEPVDPNNPGPAFDNRAKPDDRRLHRWDGRTDHSKRHTRD